MSLAKSHQHIRPCDPLGAQAGPDSCLACPCTGKGPESPQAASEAGFAEGCVRVRACLTKAGLRLEAQPRCCALLRPSCVRGGRLPHAVPFDEILSAGARERGCGACCCIPKWVRTRAGACMCSHPSPPQLTNGLGGAWLPSKHFPDACILHPGMRRVVKGLKRATLHHSAEAPGARQHPSVFRVTFLRQANAACANVEVWASFSAQTAQLVVHTFRRSQRRGCEWRRLDIVLSSPVRCHACWCHACPHPAATTAQFLRPGSAGRLSVFANTLGVASASSPE